MKYFQYVSWWRGPLLLNIKLVRNSTTGSCVLIFAIWKLSAFDNQSPKWKQAAWNKSVNCQHELYFRSASDCKSYTFWSLLLGIILQLPKAQLYPDLFESLEDTLLPEHLIGQNWMWICAVQGISRESSASHLQQRWRNSHIYKYLRRISICIMSLQDWNRIGLG